MSQQQRDCFRRRAQWGWEFNAALVFQGKLHPGGSYGDKPDSANIHLHIEIWARRRRLGEFGDLFPIIVALLYSLQAVSLENQKTDLPPTVRIKALRGDGAIKRHFEVDIQHISSRGVLGSHYCHVAYYTSVASTGRSRECAEPRQSQLIPSPSWEESSLACFSLALPEPAGMSASSRLLPRTCTPGCFSPPLSWPSCFSVSFTGNQMGLISGRL